MVSLRVIEGGLAASGRARRSVLPSLIELRERLYKSSRRALKIGAYEIEVRREPFRSVDGEEHEYAIQHRQTFCVIKRDEADIGCALLVELQPPPLCMNGVFWDALDSYSMDHARLAEVICEAWPSVGTDVSDYGNIVEVRIVGCWAPISDGPQLLEALIERLVPKHSILVVQASPLNPKNLRALNAPSLEHIKQRRRRALMRMCERRLGFKPFVSKDAVADGWMWRPRADLANTIRAPSAKPLSPDDWSE